MGSSLRDDFETRLCHSERSEESPRYVFVINGAPYEEIPRQARDDIYSINGD